MSEGKYHIAVRRALYDWGKAQPGKFKAFFGDETPLDVRHKTVDLPIAYRPDVYFKYCRQNGIIIFEVLHSQNKDNDLTWADAILSYLVRDVRKVIFVTCAGGKTFDRIKDGVLSILRILSDLKLENTEILPGEVRVYQISEAEARNKSTLMKAINKYCKKDKW